MPLSALALVLLAALLHAGWNIIAKRTGGDDRFAFLSAVFVSVIWLPAAVWAGAEVWRSWSLWVWAVLGASAVLHVLYFTVLLAGYRAADLTVVYPVARGTGPLLTATAAVLLLGERLSGVALIGIAAVCVGIFVLADGLRLWRVLLRRASTAATEDAAARAEGRRALAGVRWGLVTGALIAGYSVVDGYAVKVLLVSPILVDYVGNLLRIPLLLPAALRDRAALVDATRTQWRAAAAVAVMGPLAYVLVLFAVQQAPLSLVAPARELSMLFAALLGGRLLGEGDARQRLLGALLMAAGVGALALG